MRLRRARRQFEGAPEGPLRGVPVAVKVREYATQHGVRFGERVVQFESAARGRLAVCRIPVERQVEQHAMDDLALAQSGVRECVLRLEIDRRPERPPRLREPGHRQVRHVMAAAQVVRICVGVRRVLRGGRH